MMSLQEYIEYEYENHVPKFFKEKMKGVLYKENVVKTWLDIESLLKAYA